MISWRVAVKLPTLCTEFPGAHQQDCRGGQCDYLCVQFKHDGHKMVVAKNPEHWVLDASTLVLADFSGSCKVEHPSEAVNVESFGFPSYFCRASAYHTLQLKPCHTVF